ncbi:MAG: hypothetical protein CV087_16760 [Candidatus Brocadia sp. WS118]|nr:MAG: hypothetical protein CV087_16760 [Candidatus Brocadia sp. WS118]
MATRGNLIKLSPLFLPVFGGIGFILIFFQADITGSTFWAAFLPTGVVIIYALLIYYFILKNDDLNLGEHYTETIYFLGFLFTLLAIFSLLYKYNFSELSDIDKNPQRLNEVINYVGIAVLTTIAGIVLRNIGKSIYLSKHEGTDYDELLKKMDEHKQYSQQFLERYEEIFNFIKASFTERKEAIEELNKKEQQYLSNLGKLNETIDSFCTSLNKGGKTYNESLNNQQNIIKGMIEALKEAINKQEASFKNSNEKLSEFDKSVKEVADNLRSSINPMYLENVSMTISTFNKEVTELEVVLDKFIKIIEEKVNSLTV